MGVGLLLALVSCGNTRKGPAASCAGADCGGAGGASAEGGASSTACEGPDCPICAEGERKCQDGDVFACTREGRSFNAVELCPTGTTCNPDTVRCEPLLDCAPNGPGCDGSRVGTCNAAGTQLLPGAEDCADRERICHQGACLVCVPGLEQCLAGDVVTCDDEGESYTLDMQCTPNYHCKVVPPGVRTCLINDCQPGQKLCLDNMIKSCTDQGELAEGGEACPADLFCLGGACVEAGCVPGTLSCVGKDVYICESAISPLRVSQTCNAGTHCASTGEGVACHKQLCVPRNESCIENRVGACSHDGLSLAEVSADCAETGQVCDASLDCQAAVTEETGGYTVCELLTPGEAASTHFMAGAAFDVLSARRLTSLGAYLQLDTEVELLWMLGEQNGDGSYQNQLLATTTGQGTGWFVSSPIDVELLAGEKYTLGVAISEPGGMACHDTMEWVRPVSFGIVPSRATGSVQHSFASGASPFALRLTTEAP